jgi:hypothetical protein
MSIRHFQFRAVRWYLLGGAIVVIGSIGALLWHTSQKSSSNVELAATANPTATKQPAKAPPAVPIGITSRVLFMGDTFWDRALNLAAQNSPLKEAYPFSKLSEFNRQNYDAWVANLECPSVPGVQQPYELEVEKLAFNCPSTYLPEAAKWFTAFSLANNHTANQGGQVGLEATRMALEQAGIQYFGDFDPRILANVCEVVTIQTKVQYSDKSERPGVMPIALCGYHGLATVPSAESLAVMQQYAKIMPVVAYPHMGVEYTARPTSGQQNLYRAMIDNGADAVLGGHPHWVQPAEVYKNKLIVYSMGNFIFDQLAGETQRGAAIDATFKLSSTNTDSQQLEALLKLGASCKAFHDDCLTQATAQKLTRPALNIQYDVVGVDMTNHLTRPASADITSLIKTRLNWDQVGAEINK